MADAAQIVDCWNQIGVWSGSDASCPQLKTAVHCRNCAVYSAAGRVLLERELSQDARLQLAAQYAQPTVHAGLRLGASYTVFRIAAEWLALPTRLVHCVSDPQPTRRIPHRRHPALRGMANISGSVELVISLEALLGIDAAPAQTAARALPRMLLLNEEAGRYAFAVAEVLGVCRHDEACLAAVPSTLERAVLRYVRNTMEVAGAGAARLQVGVLDPGLLGHGVEQILK